MRFSRSLPAVVVFVLGLVLAGGCTTARRTTAPAPVTPAAMPAPAAETVPAAPPGPATPAGATPAPVPNAPATPPAPSVAPTAEAGGALELLVESAPSGAIIVLDGVPVGRAPLHLQIAATPLGFFPDYREIRARFVASDEEQVTRSSIEEFTPREKVPAVVRFSPAGAQRTLR